MCNDMENTSWIVNKGNNKITILQRENKNS